MTLNSSSEEPLSPLGVVTLLVCYGAGSLAGGLAGCLALAATFIFSGFQSGFCDGFNIFHCRFSLFNLSF